MAWLKDDGHGWNAPRLKVREPRGKGEGKSRAPWGKFAKIRWHGA